MISINGETLPLVSDLVVLQGYSEDIRKSFYSMKNSLIFEGNVHNFQLLLKSQWVDSALTDAIKLTLLLTEYQKVLKILLSTSSSSSGQKGETSNQKEV